MGKEIRIGTQGEDGGIFPGLEGITEEKVVERLPIVEHLIAIGDGSEKSREDGGNGEKKKGESGMDDGGARYLVGDHGGDWRWLTAGPVRRGDDAMFGMHKKCFTVHFRLYLHLITQLINTPFPLIVISFDFWEHNMFRV